MVPIIATLKLSGLARIILAVIVLLSQVLGNAPELEAQKSGIERTGDILQVVIPAVAFSATVGNHDSEGRAQFVKSFLANFTVTALLKFVIAKERPDGTNDRSMPSGHTSTAFQGASFIHLRYGWEKGFPAYLGATFVGFSRVYADKHYVSDVVGGAAVGILSSVLFTDRFERLKVTPVAGEGRGEGRYGVQVRLSLLH